MSAAIEVRGLRKAYAGYEAVRGIDLRVEEGEVFALLGPNGAGKTTTVEILEGHRTRSAGEVSVLGVDPAGRGRALKEQLGIVLQSTGVEPYLTVAEVVELYRGYYPSPRPARELLELVGLADQGRSRVKRLSGGQRRRLDLAVALAGDPRLLFLDEPTTGFDPSARRSAWETVKRLAGSGTTVFLTTHFMDEAQVLADRIAVIADGRIVAQGTPDDLGGREHERALVRFRVTSPSRPRLPATLSGAQGEDGLIELQTDDPVRVLHELTGWALATGDVLEGLEVLRPSLEDVYLRLTGKPEAGR